MGLTVRNMFKIVHELCPTAMIGVQGLVNGNPYDTIALYVYPDDDGFWGEREVVQVKSETDQHLKVVSVTLSVNMDGGRSKKKVKEKMGYFTVTKAGMTLGKLLSVFKSDFFEIHFSGREDEGYICGNLATGEVLHKILKDDVLNSKVIEAHVEAYGDDFAGVSVTVDYNLDKEEQK